MNGSKGRHFKDFRRFAYERDPRERQKFFLLAAGLFLLFLAASAAALVNYLDWHYPDPGLLEGVWSLRLEEAAGEERLPAPFYSEALRMDLSMVDDGRGEAVLRLEDEVFLRLKLRCKWGKIRIRSEEGKGVSLNGKIRSEGSVLEMTGRFKLKDFAFGGSEAVSAAGKWTARQGGLLAPAA